MSAVLDQQADTNHQDLFIYAQLYPMPDYVKQASMSETCEPPELPSASYADTSSRQFPCHTKAACYISNLFFLEKRPEIHEKIASWIEQRLKQFSSNWKITEDVTALQSKFAELHKDAVSQLPDSSFALVWAEDGNKERRYPIRNALEVKAAAEWFNEYRDHFAFNDRQKIACKITDKADQFGVGLGAELDDMLEKQSGRGVYDPKEAASFIRHRVKLAKATPELRANMLKLADTVENDHNLVMDLTSTANLAATIDQFDRVTNLHTKYGNGVTRPEDFLFKSTLKMASHFVKNACEMTNGSIYDKSQFVKLSLGNIQSLFGTDLAREISNGIRVDPEKMATVAATLPVPDANMLDDLMSEVGEAPIKKQAMALATPQEEREKLAQAYQFVEGLG